MELGERVPYKRKLIEVALPLDAISKASLREKSIRDGHPVDVASLVGALSVGRGAGGVVGVVD